MLGSDHPLHAEWLPVARNAYRGRREELHHRGVSGRMRRMQFVAGTITDIAADNAADIAANIAATHCVAGTDSCSEWKPDVRR